MKSAVTNETLAYVAMGAACWAAGIPCIENEHTEKFREQVNEVLKMVNLHFDFERYFRGPDD